VIFFVLLPFSSICPRGRRPEQGEVATMSCLVGSGPEWDRGSILCIESDAADSLLSSLLTESAFSWGLFQTASNQSLSTANLLVSNYSVRRPAVALTTNQQPNQRQARGPDRSCRLIASLFRNAALPALSTKLWHQWRQGINCVCPSRQRRQHGRRGVPAAGDRMTTRLSRSSDRLVVRSCSSSRRQRPVSMAAWRLRMLDAYEGRENERKAEKDSRGHDTLLSTHEPQCSMAAREASLFRERASMC
jgi:hypothetical protein